MMCDVRPQNTQSTVLSFTTASVILLPCAYCNSAYELYPCHKSLCVDSTFHALLSPYRLLSLAPLCFTCDVAFEHMRQLLIRFSPPDDHRRSAPEARRAAIPGYCSRRANCRTHLANCRSSLANYRSNLANCRSNLAKCRSNLVKCHSSLGKQCPCSRARCPSSQASCHRANKCSTHRASIRRASSRRAANSSRASNGREWDQCSR